MMISIVTEQSALVMLDTLDNDGWWLWIMMMGDDDYDWWWWWRMMDHDNES